MNNDESIYTRSQMLVGENAISILNKKTVLVVGIGGVGGTCFEALVRSGVNNLIIIDNDKVNITNLNRQLLFLKKDIGKSKVNVAKQRAAEINNDCNVFTREIFLDGNNINELDQYHIDYIVDAIDSIASKVVLIKYAKERNIPLITSLGMGNRLDSSKVTVMTLNKSTGDPLAKRLRYLLKQDLVDISNIMCVISTEEPITRGTIISSMMMVPSSAGLLLASYVIKELIKGVE